MLLRIARVRPLAGRSVSLTLTDGTVVERDLQDVLRLGGVLAPIEASDAVFRRVAVPMQALAGVVEPLETDDEPFRRASVDYGMLVWLGGLDMALETLIWDGPYPSDEATRRPEPFLRPQIPR